MLRSLFSAVAGLNNHQSRMDVMGNNLANVNTPGFKTGRATFQELLNQNIRGALRPVDRPGYDRGGTNPMQIGLGMAMASVDTIHTQGSIQETGRPGDLAIDGTGFFVVRGLAGVDYYTRAGAFSWDQQGNLVTPEGLFVRGWRVVGGLPVDPLVNLQLTAADLQAPANVTGNVEFSGNFAADGATYARSVTIYDNVGTEHMVDLDFTAIPVGQHPPGLQLTEASPWTMNVGPPINYNGQLAVFPVVPGSVQLTADDAGVLVTLNDDGLGGLVNAATGLPAGTINYVTGAITGADFGNVVVTANTVTATYTPQDLAGVPGVPAGAYRVWHWSVPGAVPPVEGGVFFDQFGTQVGSRVWDTNAGWVDQGGHAYLPNAYLTSIGNFSPGHRIVMDFSGATQFASGGLSDLSISQDGFQFGNLVEFNIDSSGVVTGVYDNGVTRPLMQVALVQFVNSEGLRSAGSTMFAETPNSGDPNYGQAGTGGLGVINPGSLEMSNADMARQFTDMITTQRGFQANARTITASDELLQELVNLVR